MTPAEHTLAQPIVRRLEALAASLEPLSDLPAATHVLRLCRGAIEHFHDENLAVDRPLHVAIVGGTGVGKSALFNTLIGKPGASPVSATRRCFTDRPYVAVSPGTRPKVNRLDELDAVYVDAPRLGPVVLIDTPDLNGDVPSHHERARQVIARSDLVLFVTIPDQRADFDLLQQLTRYRSRQHWLFLMNKVDREGGELDAMRADFDGRLRTIGFEPDDRSRFFVSAVEAEKHDLPRLREMLLTPQPTETVRLSRLDVALGYAQEALSDRSLAPLHEKATALRQQLSQMEGRVHAVYRDALDQPDVQRQLRRLVRDRAWSESASRVGWPMSLALHLRNRVALLATGYHLTRLATGSVGPLRLVQLALSSVAAAARGLLPVMHIAELLERDARAELEHLERATRRLLEDHGFATAAVTPAAATQGTPAAAEPVTEEGERRSLVTLDPRRLPQQIATATVDEATGRANAAARRFVSDLRFNSPLAAPLERAVDRAGVASAGRAIGWLTLLLANVLPLAAIGHIGYRLGEGWILAEYLPWPFYPMALAVLLISFLPGYAWVAFRLRFAGRIPEPAEVLEDIREHPVVEPLRNVTLQLERLAQQGPALRRQVLALRRELADELGGSLGQWVIEEGEDHAH